MSERDGECDRDGCSNPERLTLRIDVMPAGFPEYKGPPAEVHVGIRVCVEHATQQAADEIKHHGTEWIVNVCKATRRALPDPERTIARWVPIQ